MKNYLLLLLVSMFANIIVRSQTFHDPDPSYPDILSPIESYEALAHVIHSSAHHNTEILPNHLFVYSWSGDGTISPGFPYDAGFVFRYQSPSGSLINEGFQPYTGVMDLDVGIMATDDGSILIISSYYKIGIGHFADIWRWDVGIGEVIFQASYILSTSSQYYRIGLDIHRHYAGVITWQVADKIFVKTFRTSPTIILGNSFEVITAENGYFPDVAIAFPDSEEMKVRITYIDQPTGDVKIAHHPFDPLLYSSGTTAYFIDDYTIPGVYSSVPSTYWSTSIINLPNSLHIDCPNTMPEDDRWAVIYSDVYGDRIARAISKYSNSSPPAFLNLSNTLRASYYSICYDNTAKVLECGFYTVFPLMSPPNEAGYLAVSRHIDGSYITPIDEYKQITNPTAGFSKPIMSFSKASNSELLFVAYPFTYGYMGIKTLPWSYYGSIKSNKNIINTNLDSFVIYPNPTSRFFQVSIPVHLLSELLKLEIVSLNGKVIYSTEMVGKKLGQENIQFPEFQKNENVVLRIINTSGKILHSQILSKI